MCHLSGVRAIMSSKAGPATIRVRLVRSALGYSQRQKATIRALGLRKLHSSVEQVATPQIRGMLQKVTHLVEVEEI